MPNKTDKILNRVADYYSKKLAEHGETPRGVDWNGEKSQSLRFEQLTKVIEQSQSFSLNDLGCGYGALLDYMNLHYKNFIYNGLDVSIDMILSARDRYTKHPNSSFSIASKPSKVSDYGIASGIFNVRLGRSDAEWYDHLKATLDALNCSSRSGFSFNCLTIYSDVEKMRDYLFYANPCTLFDLCKQRYSRHVALLHDYGLYEFTILVRK